MPTNHRLLRHSRAAAAGFALLCAAFLPSARSAAPLSPWGTIELGIGQLHRSVSGRSASDGRFFLNFEGGLAVTPQVLLGLEVGGWLLQASDPHDPTKGSGITQVYAVAEIRPQPDSPWLVHVSGGSLRAWDNAATGVKQNGTGWECGVGYDYKLGEHSALSPFLRYSSGSAGTLKISAVTLGVGFSWR